MDISQFGLFDLTSRQLHWTGQAGTAAEDRIVPIGPVRGGIANDNVRREATQTRRSGPERRSRPRKSLLRLILHRGAGTGAEMGPA